MSTLTLFILILLAICQCFQFPDGGNNQLIADGYDDSYQRPSNSYPFLVQMWTRALKQMLELACSTNNDNRNFLEIANDWINEWSEEIIKNPVGPYGDNYKDNFFETVEPKLSSLLRQQVEAGYLKEAAFDHVKMLLDMERADFNGKLYSFGLVVNSDSKHYMSDMFGRYQATPLYETLITGWCDLVKTVLGLAVGATNNMTNGGHFIELANNLLDEWAEKTIARPPGQRGELWRQSFWQTLKPSVDQFFASQQVPEQHDLRTHVKSREPNVRFVMALIETGRLDKMAQMSEQLASAAIITHVDVKISTQTTMGDGNNRPSFQHAPDL